MKKPIAAAAIAATTLGGVAAGATVLGPGFAGAQDDTEAPAEAEELRLNAEERLA